jgi:hypothetical protein
METQEWHNQQTKGFLKKSGVECMIPSQAKMQFDAVLRKQQLVDVVSAFGDRDFFDEVPLYSRYNQVEFLKHHGDVNLLLIELALDYLGRVMSEIHTGSDKRFVAITVISDDQAEYIVPSVFVCNGKIKTRLKELHLLPPSEGLGKQIEALVRKANLHADFGVLEDRVTVPDDVRVFISYNSSPHGLVSLRTFANGVAAI